MSGHSAEERFVIVADTRRRRSRAEREAIVAELLASGKSVSAVARKHNLAPSLLFRWRREFGAKVAASKNGPGRSFVPIVLPAPASMHEAAIASKGGSSAAIEIVLSSGRRVIVGKDVDVGALKRIIEALEAG
jgi:transposase